MNDRMKRTTVRILILVALTHGVAACGGTKVLKEPQPLAVMQPLAQASDEQLAATLDWVIVRDGPGTWARNVDWDEYLMRVRNLGDESIQVTGITVVDSLGTEVQPRYDRKQLVKGSRETKRRYKDADLEIKAGAGVGTLMTAGAVAGATTIAVVAAGPLAISTGSAALASGGLLLAPAFAVGGIVRGVNNSKVNKQIESRQTSLPAVQPGEEKYLDIFFPLTPSPRQIELTYMDSRGEHKLIIDSSAALNGLHLPEAEPK